MFDSQWPMMYHGVLQWSKLMCKHQVDINIISIENVTASGSGIINMRSYFCDTWNIPDTRTTLVWSWLSCQLACVTCLFDLFFPALPRGASASSLAQKGMNDLLLV